MGREIKQLTPVIQKAINTRVPENRPCPLSKGWWIKDLKKTKKIINYIHTESYRNQAVDNHPSHQDLYQAHQKYVTDIAKAKIDHWSDFLENTDAADIWSVNKYLMNPSGDGGQTRIPTLKVKGNDGIPREVNTNKGKANILSEAFFLLKPAASTVPQAHKYPDPLPPSAPVTKEQIHAHIAKLSPYKAPGLDRIPNIVLQKSANLIVPYLLPIYRSMLKNGTYYYGWQESMTCVLRKPRKPNYEIPKHTTQSPYSAPWPKS